MPYCQFAAMDQHLVHDDLEEERRDQGEELQGERDQQHLAQELAVLDHRRDEPGEVELGQFAGQRGPAGDEDEFAVPEGIQLLALEDLRPDVAGVLDQGLVAIEPREDEVAAVMGGGQRGQGRTVQSGFGGDPLGFEAELLGGEQDLLGAEGLARRLELVGELVRIGGDSVEARQHGQAQQAGVGLGARLRSCSFGAAGIDGFEHALLPVRRDGASQCILVGLR